MVVGAVVDVLGAVGLQRAVQVDGGGPGGEVEGVDDPFLVRRGRAGGKPAGPDLRRRGDQSKIHRHGHVAYQGVQIPHIPVQLGRVWGVHPVDEGVLFPEIDPVVLLFAAEPLAPGFGGHPKIPAHNVVGDVVLRILHKPAAAQVFRRQLGGLLKVAVFQRGKVHIRQQQADHGHAPDEGAEQDGEKDTVFFCHVRTSSEVGIQEGVVGAVHQIGGADDQSRRDQDGTQRLLLPET